MGNLSTKRIEPGATSGGTEMELSAVSLPSKRIAVLGWTSLFLAAIEAACVALISTNQMAALLGLGQLAAVKMGIALHAAAIRLPLLSFATLGAIANLIVVWNGNKLRNASTARWRYHPLTVKQKLRLMFVLCSSVLTLMIVAGELYAHWKLHGTEL
jgi:hypothetical protein